MNAYYKTPEIETVFVNHMHVACDGGSGVSGHPIEYLHLNHHSKDATCPYCSKRFVLKD